MIGLLEVTVLSLAAYRGTQMVVYDQVSDPIRRPVEMRHAATPDSKLWWFLHFVLTCIFCAGMYVSGAALLAYLLATGRWDDSSWLVHGVEWFAVAGGQALLNRAEDSWGTGS